MVAVVASEYTFIKGEHLMTNLESFFAGLMISFALLSTYVIVDVASHHEKAMNQSTWSPPDIPQCDKELWVRIKDGCND